MMKPIIRINNLSKSYDGQMIFDQLNFDIFEGEILVVLGPSGVGKSTLLNILSRQDLEYEGSIDYDACVFDNIDIPLPIVFQDFQQLLPWYSVKKNILLPYERKDFTPEDDKLIAFVALEKHLDKRPSQLSGGMKQRVAIARALLSDSKIIFMDEPFGSLDTERRHQLQGLIAKLNKNYQKTVVFITHDEEEAKRIATRIARFTKDGKLLVET